MSTLPTLYISHGSPMLAVEPGVTGLAWAKLATGLPRPRAILAVSAHWLTRLPTVSAATAPETIHDFYGFPPSLYQIQYRPPGAPALAERVSQLIPQTAADVTRGVDHGAWVPLRCMYPAADVPVAQFGVLPEATPEAHFRLGERLRPLCAEGVLILASGSLTHNLRDMQMSIDADSLRTNPYVIEFSDWMADALRRHDLEALFDYRRRAPHAVRAHPTDEHLLPLFVALGAADPQAAFSIPYHATTMGALSMDAYLFSPP